MPHGIEVAGRAGGVEAVEVEVDVVGTEELAEYLGHRRRVRPVSSRVLGMVRRHYKWPPTRLFGRRCVPVVESGYWPITVCCHGRRVDRRHRPPEQEPVLEIEHRHQASALAVLTIASSRAV